MYGSFLTGDCLSHPTASPLRDIILIYGEKTIFVHRIRDIFLDRR